MQRKENEGAFKRRATNPANGSCRRKGTSGGNGRLTLEVDWEVRLRSWNFYCMVKRLH